MSNSDNPFSAPTTVADSVAKSPAPKRGVAHIVRRSKLSEAPPAAKESAKSASSKGGKPHVISRNPPIHLAEDSVDQMITSPVLKTPQEPADPVPEPRGKRHAPSGGQATVRGGGPIGTGSVDEFTVEEGRPHPPTAMVALADRQEMEVAPPEDPSRGFLALRSGKDLGRRVGLLEGRTTIGRGLDCDIVLTDPTISRKHLYIERRENVYVVCDLGSGNGTFVNERERQEEVLIVNGDTFRIGNSVICFEGPEAQEEAGSTRNWGAPAEVRGKKKGRSRQVSEDEESTVAGKAQLAESPPTHLDEPMETTDPLTQAPTGIAPGGQAAAKRSNRKTTIPPKIPEDKKSVQDAAIAALSSIVNTPPPKIVAARQTGLGELPNQTVPPTPSPAILYPIGGPSNQYPSAAPPVNLGQAQPSLPQNQGLLVPGSSPRMAGYHRVPGTPMPMPMSMPQGSQGQMPRGQGAPPMGGYRQPSGQQLQRPMLAGGAPSMQAAYGGANPAPRENGKLLIGFISVTLVLVVVGLLATVIGQMDESNKGGDKNVAALGDDAGTAGISAAPGETATGETATGETATGETATGETATGETATGETATGETATGETATGETATGETATGETAPGKPRPKRVAQRACAWQTSRPARQH